MSLICTNSGTDQSQTYRDTINVCIYQYHFLSLFQMNGTSACRCSTGCYLAPASNESDQLILNRHFQSTQRKDTARKTWLLRRQIVCCVIMNQ